MGVSSHYANEASTTLQFLTHTRNVVRRWRCNWRFCSDSMKIERSSFRVRDSMEHAKVQSTGSTANHLGGANYGGDPGVVFDLVPFIVEFDLRRRANPTRVVEMVVEVIIVGQPEFQILPAIKKKLPPFLLKNQIGRAHV